MKQLRYNSRIEAKVGTRNEVHRLALQLLPAIYEALRPNWPGALPLISLVYGDGEKIRNTIGH